MCERQTALDELDVRVIAVTFESARAIERYQEKERLLVPLLRDPGRKAYRRFGLGRGDPASIWGRETLFYYGREFLRGRMPAQRRADAYQLGGDVILNADLSGGWIYRSRHPADRPSLDSVIEHLRRADAFS